MSAETLPCFYFALYKELDKFLQPLVESRDGGWWLEGMRKPGQVTGTKAAQASAGRDCNGGAAKRARVLK